MKSREPRVLQHGGIQGQSMQLADVWVEPVSEADLDTISDAWTVLVQLREDLSLARLRELLLGRERVDMRLRYSVARREKDCIGVVGWRFVRNSRLGLHVYIEDLIIDASFRNCGLGTLLLGEVERDAREKGCFAIVLDSSIRRAEAHSFYQASGFVRTAVQFVHMLPP